MAMITLQTRSRAVWERWLQHPGSVAGAFNPQAQGGPRGEVVFGSATAARQAQHETHGEG